MKRQYRTVPRGKTRAGVPVVDRAGDYAFIRHPKRCMVCAILDSTCGVSGAIPRIRVGQITNGGSVEERYLQRLSPGKPILTIRTDPLAPAEHFHHSFPSTASHFHHLSSGDNSTGFGPLDTIFESMDSPRSPRSIPLFATLICH